MDASQVDEEDARSTDSHDHGAHLAGKEVMAVTLLKIDHFAARLAAIQAQVATRSLDAQSRHAPTQAPSATAPLYGSPLSISSVSPRKLSRNGGAADTMETRRLPLLQQLERNDALPADNPLSFAHVQQRATRQQQFMNDAEQVAHAEEQAAVAIQEADRLAEDVRIGMLMYAQNERSWTFDERARRYQLLLEAKNKADAARKEADAERSVARQLRAKLTDPYGSHRRLRVSPSSPLSALPKSPSAPSTSTTGTAQVASVAHSRDDYALVWLLAAPSPNITFTPREQTVQMMLNQDKELSMHVVYYAALSVLNDSEGDLEALALLPDHPPRDGWLCSSTHGVAPAPSIVSTKASVETWIVAGAGALHVNGKYIASGQHNGLAKFKSSTGVELFRKWLPKASSVTMGLYDAPTSKGAASLAHDDNHNEDNEDAAAKTNQEQHSEAVVLPIVLQQMANDVLNFDAMRRIGSWLGANEVNDKLRRQREKLEFQLDTPSPGDHVNVQDVQKRAALPNALAPSRVEAVPELCREWVLFLHCSRRPRPRDDPAAPPAVAGLGCLKRHYYVSHEEQARMSTWAQAEEAWLEKRVLHAIIQREEQLARLQNLATKCMKRFQQDLKAETTKTARKLLTELNCMRFLTVKVLEAIDTWRCHARKTGFVRYEPSLEAAIQPDANDQQDLEPPLLGWSASITVTTGKQLYKGSKAFVSKLKRFRRAEDATGKLEQRIVYLGYFALRVDAERAYDDYAVAEARRRNTTLQHMPRRRGVFRSCGKHFAIESEGMGPAFCIECKTKQLSATLSDDEWMPPFLYTPGHNYILQLATDLDFLDKLPPLQALLNDGYGFGQRFPLLGNVFLLPRTPIQDPALAFFTVLGTTQAPRLGSRNNQDDAHEIDAETLDRDRILRVQRLFLQEMQMYHPELFEQDATTTPQTRQAQLRTTMAAKVAVKPRVVEAMYWDRCTALKIAQERPPVAFRQDQVWCRPDAGEWASLVVRGCHQLHFLFETRLAASGKEMQLKRRKLLQTMRQVLRLPLYEVHDRTVLTMLVSEAQLMKGDVVLLELKNLVRFLERYDAWCMSSRIVQRWYRGVYGRKRARTRRRALRLVARTRTQHLACVATFAACYYRDNIATVAIHNAVHKLAMPVHTYAIKLEDEYAIVSLHVRQAEQDWREARPRSERELGWRVQQSNCCASCARRFRVQSFYSASTRKFQVIAGPCTCGVNGGHTKSRPRQEQWLLRAYSPTNNRVYRLCIANSLLQQLARALGLGNLVDCSSPDSRKVWNPVEEMRIKHQRAITTARLTEFCSRQAALALEMVLNWRMLSAEATQHRKIVVLRLEQATEALETRRREYATSIVLAKKAVDFTSKKFHEAQAWDALENSNDWKLLVDKRAAEKNVAAAELEQERCRFDAFQAHFNEQFLRARTSQEHAQFEHTRVPVQKQWTAQLEHAAADENRATARVETLMQSLARHLVTLRDTFLAPTRRQLVIRSAAWRQPPLYVAMPGLAHGRNTLVRRGLLLTNHALDRSNARSHLMIVDVSVWPSGDIGRDPRTERDVWIQAYDAKTSYVHTVFLEWELVQMLLARRGRKLKALGARAHQHTIATRLLAMTMLDRYTGEFTLEKLRFYHILRVLAPQVLSSKWFRDLERGRKSGRGDLVLRQALCLHGHLAVVAVYENWGDLTLCVYESATARDLRLTLPLDRVLALLSTRPALLHLWVHCVKSNTYDPTVLTAILQSVRFTDTGDGLLTTSDVVAEPRTRTFRRSLRIQDRRVLVFVSADQSGDLRIKAFDLRQSHTYTLFIERAHLRRLLRRSRDASAVANSSIPGIVPESLLGRRHWGGLCEWLCQRLVFQSLGEHPDALVAAHSPVSSGLAVRHSYDVLNEWIGHAPRNPLQPVPKDVIDRASAHIDAQAFSCVLFDQLAVVAEPKLPFDHGKHWLLSAPCKVPALAATLPSPFMVDWFVRGHTLHAREFAVALTTLERARDAVSLGTISMDHRQLEVMVGHAPWRQLCERSMENLASILRLTSRQDSGGLAIELKHDTQLLHMVDDVAVAASDVTPKGFKLDHLQVEVDCVWQPRRLIFSCREVRTQQVYFVDCSYHQLRAETGSALCLWPDSSTSLTVVDWRELARKAAARIVVCKHNGRLELEIGPKQAVAVDADTGLESIATDVASELERSSESVLDAPLHTTGAISRRWREQRQDVLRRCAWHRFQKHQTAILVRQTIALAKQQVLAVERQRLGLEWMQMIREDWRSQQYRGVLVLDNKQLKKLQAAFTTGTRRAKMKHEDAAHTPEHSSPMPLLVEQQLIEIAKEMGLHAPTSGEMQAHLAQMRSMRWWKEAQSPSSVVNDQDNPMPLIDVIEWWRLHVASQSLRHRHIK
ncbi:TPA: hypothetical protein N0F65_009921 [Lagenidium giganteum]|uniref:Uncharacterized protein n=1 Tax=Lagenidium giganteum TaxID=4803 RepID=A0AAV2YL36_9STRA|nr:TPA: hypothetical protein N0F65_009921 [Lagenidium giganteum]